MAAPECGCGVRTTTLSRHNPRWRERSTAPREHEKIFM
jgi:hypothetical protein